MSNQQRQHSQAYGLVGSGGFVSQNCLDFDPHGDFCRTQELGSLGSRAGDRCVDVS